MAKDVFPPDTKKTWIILKLEEGETGRDEVNAHVMGLYAFPLQVYFKGIRAGSSPIVEPEEAVQGFFADRLARKEFFGSWQKSGLRLRRWLVKGFSFYLKELQREARKLARQFPLPDEGLPVETNHEEELDRAFAQAVVKEALARTERLCESQGLREHWEVFRRHFYEGEAYGRFAEELGITTKRAPVMARTAMVRFKKALRDLLAQDGATEEEINDEIRSLLEVTGG